MLSTVLRKWKRWTPALSFSSLLPAFHLPVLNLLHSGLGQLQSLLEPSDIWCEPQRLPSSYCREKCCFSLLELGVIMCLRKNILREKVFRWTLRHFEAKHLWPTTLCEHLGTTFKWAGQSWVITLSLLSKHWCLNSKLLTNIQNELRKQSASGSHYGEMITGDLAYKYTHTHSQQGNVFGKHLLPNHDLKANQLQLTFIFSPQVQMLGSYHRNWHETHCELPIDFLYTL